MPHRCLDVRLSGISYRDRLEHFARGYEWTFFVGPRRAYRHDLALGNIRPTRRFSISTCAASFSATTSIGKRTSTSSSSERYGFESSDEPFDRTYRRMSNLDDMHENGVHDYLKYVKFGYGRCTDHVCKDVRAGLMTRAQGLELVRRLDHVKPRDLTAGSTMRG